MNSLILRYIRANPKLHAFALEAIRNDRFLEWVDDQIDACKIMDELTQDAQK